MYHIVISISGLEMQGPMPIYNVIKCTLVQWFAGILKDLRQNNCVELNSP